MPSPGVVVRVKLAHVIQIIPRIGGPEVHSPGERAREVQALADETRLNTEIDRREVDRPLRRIGVKHKGVCRTKPRLPLQAPRRWHLTPRRKPRAALPKYPPLYGLFRTHRQRVPAWAPS